MSASSLISTSDILDETINDSQGILEQKAKMQMQECIWKWYVEKKEYNRKT